MLQNPKGLNLQRERPALPCLLFYLFSFLLGWVVGVVVDRGFARAVKKTFRAGFRCGGWLFCSACTIGMADGRLFGFCFYLKKSNNIKAKYNVPDVCVRRAVAVGGGI